MMAMGSSMSSLKRKNRVEAVAEESPQDDSSGGNLTLSKENNGGRVTTSEDEDGDEEPSPFDSDSSYFSESGDSVENYLAYEQFARQKEAEVQKAYTALEAATKAGKRIPIGPVADEGEWDLYSSEYHSHHFDPRHLTKCISFGNNYKAEYGFPPEMTCKPGQISAGLNIYPEGHFDILPFDKPAYASLEPVTIKSMGDVEVEVIFLGNGFLKLRVELDFLLKEHRILRATRASNSYTNNSQSKIIEFAGVWKSNAERRRERAKRFRRNQSSSPTIATRMTDPLYCGW
ncbi:hypothetical protein VTN77DRAFT_1480 [Rasamsonia byssochlamydoides]|uniref:uncharacterized protein n=1 Tax=Rasamsonia byssochlamydoides TaxID=89139 RepID=UPI0037432841